MNLKKFTLASTITVLALFLSSCSGDHYRWVAGYLDGGKTFYTNKSGYLEDYFRVDDRNIFSDYGRISEIRDVEFVGNDEVRLDIWSNAIIDELWLDIDGTNVELYFRNVEGANDYYDGDVNYFVDIIVDQIRRHGYANINIEARSRYRDVQIDVRVLGDLDVYIRD